MSEGCCCSGGKSCCFPDPERRRIEIDFLYLDLSVCTRCVGADASLDAAIADVSTVLKAAGFDVVVNEVNITSGIVMTRLLRFAWQRRNAPRSTIGFPAHPMACWFSNRLDRSLPNRALAT